MKLFELWATLGLDTRDFEQSTKHARGTAQNFGNTIQNGLKASTVAVGNLMSTAVQEVASGFVDLTKQAFGAVATLEQNIGGSQQVFGDYAAEIQNWGKEAFQYVGLSQGEYLGYANRMGSLLQGMGFSQEQSLDLTTDAMQRAADVASIMGIDVSTAMEAIAGAAKGNFTMMDNLGVAINDTALANYALETGITKSVSKMSTQEKVALALEMFMNKTAYAAGNYAKENDTLAGSIQTAKASFDNLLAGSGTVDDFVRTVENAARVAFKNLKEIVPRLGQSIVSAGKLFVPKIDSLLGNLWDNELPGFVTRGVNGLIDGVNDLLGTNIPRIDTIEFPTWEEIQVKVTEWWTGSGDSVYEKLKNTLSWAIGKLDLPSTTETVETVQSWWEEIAKPPITNAVQWTFGELVLPAWADLVDSVTAWWSSEVSPQLEDLAEWFTNPQFPSWESLSAEASKWWEGIRGNLESMAKFYATYDIKRVYSTEELGAASDWSIDTTAGATTPVKGFNASGLGFVPFDGYVSELHYGEAVLTRQQAENWRTSGGSAITRQDLHEAMLELASMISSIKIQMNAKEVGHAVAPTVSAEMGKLVKGTKRYAMP